MKQSNQAKAVRLMVCTDAAAEGLYFQFCGTLINFDTPWDPMRVKQRIGRLDRLGQRFDRIGIVSLMYEDTVETDVYRVLRSRISLFAAVVGKTSAHSLDNAGKNCRDCPQLARQVGAG